MQRALGEFIVEGIETTIPLHLALLKNDEFRSGNYDTGIMDRFDYSTIVKD
jgi:acetyl-CoA carboxylase biotin carboxylase subunit